MSKHQQIAQAAIILEFIETLEEDSQEKWMHWEAFQAGYFVSYKEDHGWGTYSFIRLDDQEAMENGYEHGYGYAEFTADGFQEAMAFARGAYLVARR